jgi:hypothetical protein
MKKRYLISGMLVLSLLTACAGPQIKLFTDATDPLKEFTPKRVCLAPLRAWLSRLSRN